MARSGWVHVLLAALSGCGGNATAGDGGLADAEAGACPLPEGQSFLVSRLALAATEEVAFDLDGDGGRNELGKVPAGARTEINASFESSIEAGEMVILFHVTDWADPPVADDPEVTLHVFTGTDADTPPDPSNNTSGEGRFYASVAEFDLDCNSRTASDEARIEDRVLSARRAVWSFPITTGTGTVRFNRAQMVLPLAEDFGTADGELGFVLDFCTLSAIPFPGTASGTFLDILVNEPTITAAIAPDVDLDGDGVEQVVGDGVTVRECIDGDGTVISGRTCPCHPDIVDGYSVGAYLSLVSAVILDVR